MENQEEFNEVKNIVQAFLKAKKISRMYPRNNPIYVKAMEELWGRLDKFLKNAGGLQFNFGKHDIFYNSQSLYHNPERQDNLALLFFKDGLRELTFKKGITSEELGDFINIISQDFEREATEDDLVTFLWEKNFENIRYVVEDSFLIEGEELEEKAVREAKQKKCSEKECLQKLYEDSQGDNGAIKDPAIFSLTDEDFRSFFDDLERDASDRTRKFFNILFEIFSQDDNREGCDGMENHFIQTIEFSIKRGHLEIVTEVQSKIEQILENGNIHEEAKGHLSKILLFTGGHSIITLIGEILDSGREIEEQTIKNFFSHLRTNAITPLLKILAELKSDNSRRIVLDALVSIGRKDISILLEEVNDARCPVVRDIVQILRKIGDKRAVKTLVKLLSQKDERVRKEVVRALGELGGDSVVADLKEHLDDVNVETRKAVLWALGSIRSESAKKTVMDYIAGKRLRKRDINEKKECFRTLALWHDNDVYDFLIRIVKKRSFLSSKKAENRACAAYSLGLLNNREALPVLNRFKTSGNKLLREFSANAIRKLEYGN